MVDGAPARLEAHARALERQAAELRRLANAMRSDLPLGSSRSQNWQSFTQTNASAFPSEENTIDPAGQPDGRAIRTSPVEARIAEHVRRLRARAPRADAPTNSGKHT